MGGGGRWGGRKQCVQLQGPSLTPSMHISSEPTEINRTLLQHHVPRGAHARSALPLGTHGEQRRDTRGQMPLPRTPSTPSPTPAHRVGSVAGPERRQCEGRRRARPSSCPGDPGSGARGRRQRTAAVPCPACGEQRDERGGQLRPLGQRARRGGGGPSARPAPPPVLLQAEAIKS